jgi:hypothetical protein
VNDFGQPARAHPGERHSLDEWADELPDLLRSWMPTELDAAIRRE